MTWLKSLRVINALSVSLGSMMSSLGSISS